MSCFSLALFAIAAFTPTCTAWPGFLGDPWFVLNNRSGELYSTQRSSKEELTLPGVEIFISPTDSFDVLPSPGYNTKIEELERGGHVSASPDEAVVRGPDKNLAEWAAARLDCAPTLQKHISPRPNESLAGKVLTVESSGVVVRVDHAAVLCHALERDAHLCHKLHKPMDITEVTVSPNGKSSKLWIACHYGEGGDGMTICHVMNVGDSMFISDEVVSEENRLRQVSSNE